MNTINNNPSIRIQKIVLKDFKNVKYGEVLFPCGKKDVMLGTKSDILGLYGQNGSGKTSVIEAIEIMKSALSGEPILDFYTDCIPSDVKKSHLEFTFDFQYDDPKQRKKIIYAFDIASVEKDGTEEKIELTNKLSIKAYETEMKLDYSDFLDNPRKIKIFNEIVSVSGYIDGNQIKLQPIIRTDTAKGLFGPTRKISEYLGNRVEEKTKKDISNIKVAAEKQSESFVFNYLMMDIFKRYSNDSAYFNILRSLSLFAEKHLFVVDLRISNLVGFGVLPFYSDEENLFFIKLRGKSELSIDDYEKFKAGLNGLNNIINLLIPNLRLETNFISEGSNENNENVIFFELIAVRGENRFPLRCESQGILRIISVTWLIISAFNDKSCTVCIDELDSGVYEYLLGEILSLFDKCGLGQLIFTSHNLRPLEVISKDSIVFTTTNPYNRYFRLKGLGTTNNLRDVYIREIIRGEQGEKVYLGVKPYELKEAMEKAGDLFNVKK